MNLKIILISALRIRAFNSSVSEGLNINTCILFVIQSKRKTITEFNLSFN